MWYEGVIDGYWWQAKVNNEGSKFGIDGSRISKLSICEGSVWNHEKEIFSYDRGLDFDKCPPEVLVKVLEHCNTIPLS